ncbi:MAG: helix-turn-helix domain-containing protein [Acidobacteriota bacterium]|nr:helix-turn-helix domain-containing protein [Acidobacteriota bacterium]
MNKPKRQQIIDTAMELFIKNGFKATTMQEIADSCDMSKGAVYLHFRSKNQLMLAMMEHFDDQVQAEIQRIRNDRSLSPRDRMRAQIYFLFRDVIENQGYFDLFLRETGLRVNEEIMLFLQRCRYEWQKTQEEFLLALYGQPLKPYLIDVAAMVNGIVGEYHVIMLVEGIQIDLDRVTDFIMHVIDEMVSGLLKGNVEPVLKPEMMPTRQKVAAMWADQGNARALSVLEEMEEMLPGLGLEKTDAEDARASLGLIRTELELETPGKTIIQGMLANLRDIDAWAGHRRKMAHYLSLKLR